MTYRGDIRLDDTIDFKFTTRRFSTGAPFTLAGSPVISAYVGNGTTELTAGITLTADFDARTGLNNVRVVATAANGYAAGTNVQLVITAGTVDAISVVGEVVAEFSIEARSALMPTVVARKLDVSAGGEAGVDWANVGSPTTALALTGTTVAATQKVDIETIKTQAVTAAGAVTVLASVGTAATSTAQTGDSFARIGAAGAGLTALGDARVANLDAAVGSRMVGYTQPAGFLAATFPGTVASTTNITAGTIATVTNLTNAPTAGDLTAAMIASVTTAASAATPALSAAGNNAAADALLNRDMSTGTDSGSPTVRTVRQALRFLRNRWTLVGSTLTVNKEDDTTASWTAAVTTTPGADPITGNDPA